MIAGATFILVLLLPETLPRKILESRTIPEEKTKRFRDLLSILDVVGVDAWISLVSVTTGTREIGLAQHNVENHTISPAYAPVHRNDSLLELHLHGFCICGLLHASHEQSLANIRHVAANVSQASRNRSRGFCWRI